MKYEYKKKHYLSVLKSIRTVHQHYDSSISLIIYDRQTHSRNVIEKDRQRNKGNLNIITITAWFTFLTSDGLSCFGKLFCINLISRLTTALKLLLQAVSGSISFERKTLRLDSVTKLKEEEEAEKSHVGSDCGEEYSKKFDVAAFKIPFWWHLLCSCRFLSTGRWNRRWGTHVSQAWGNLSEFFLRYANEYFLGIFVSTI